MSDVSDYAVHTKAELLFPAHLIPSLRELGHTVEAKDMPLKANAILLHGGTWTGAADPRSEGATATP